MMMEIIMVTSRALPAVRFDFETWIFISTSGAETSWLVADDNFRGLDAFRIQPLLDVLARAVPAHVDQLYDGEIRRGKEIERVRWVALGNTKIQIIAPGEQ